MFPVSHYIKKYVDILLDTHLGKISTNYDLKLACHRSGEIFLQGNIWTSKLQRCNLTGETGTQSDLETIFKNEDYQLSGGEEEHDGEEQISHEIEPLLGPAERDHLREASLIEAYFCNGRGLQMRWASQDVQKLDIRDEEMVNYN